MDRTHSDPVVRAAVGAVTANIGAMSASDVVQLALFPQSLSEWATDAGVHAAQVVNLLRRLRPYVRLRLGLAQRLGVPVAVVSHLIDATPKRPVSERMPGREEILTTAGIADMAVRTPIDWSAPPYPPYREATNPIERIAVERMRLEAPAMPASRLVRYALFPDTIATWARRERLSIDVVLGAIGGARRSPRIEAMLAHRLGVTRDAFAEFVMGTRREAAARLPVVANVTGDAALTA